MKKRLNILCVLVIVMLCCSVFYTLYYSGIGIMAGVEMGQRQDKEELERISNMHVVSLLPDNYTFFTDSVYNTQSGSYIPATYSQLIVSVKSEANIWQTFIKGMCGFLSFVLILAAIIFFVRIIIAVNKSDIFIWKNVRRLRWVGVLLILSFICTAIPAWITNYILSGVLTVKGYSLTIIDHLTITNLVLGIVALIIAEVFAIGLRMKEEQDLTI